MMLIVLALVASACSQQITAGTPDNGGTNTGGIDTGAANNSGSTGTGGDEGSSTNTNISDTDDANTTDTGGNDNTNLISFSELSAHNSSSNCWVSYQGKVYDVTSWLPRHPGGLQAIARYCGTSSKFESAFTQKHGTRMVGRLMQEGKYKGDLK